VMLAGKNLDPSHFLPSKKSHQRVHADHPPEYTFYIFSKKFPPVLAFSVVRNLNLGR
jgi:hypothetical protein